MKVTYKDLIISVEPENADEADVFFYVLNRFDGKDLIKHHLSSLFEQRKTQKKHDDMETVFSKLSAEEITQILTRK